MERIIRWQLSLWHYSVLRRATEDQQEHVDQLDNVDQKDKQARRVTEAQEELQVLKAPQGQEVH